MKQISAILISLIVLSGVTVRAQTLGADSKTIKSKAVNIEREYSRNMRENRTRQGSSGGAIVVEEGFQLPSEQDPIIESTPTAPTTFQNQNPISGPTSFTPSRNEFERVSSSSVMTNSFDYNTNLNMRDDRKLGAGVTVGGSSGLAGVHLELNFEDADGVVAGFGAGPGYNSFKLGWKHNFEGRYIAPYTTVGYSRWYNSTGQGNDYLESDVLDRILTSEERKSGQFGTDFLNTSIGIQYNQLSGDLAGVSFFGELTGMYEIKRSNMIPSGSLGAVYFF